MRQFLTTDQKFKAVNFIRDQYFKFYESEIKKECINNRYAPSFNYYNRINESLTQNNLDDILDIAISLTEEGCFEYDEHLIDLFFERDGSQFIVDDMLLEKRRTDDTVYFIETVTPIDLDEKLSKSDMSISWDEFRIKSFEKLKNTIHRLKLVCECPLNPEDKRIIHISSNLKSLQRTGEANSDKYRSISICLVDNDRCQIFLSRASNENIWKAC